MAYNPGSHMGKEMNDEARRAINTAFDALNDWRNDMAAANERYSAKVFDQMSAATRAMGMPDEIVSATRQQLQNASRMQLQMMEQVMDVWKQQLRDPSSAMNMSSDFMKNMPDFTKGFDMGALSGMGSMPGMSMAPFQMWMQAAEMWQKNWASAMSFWAKGPQGLTEMMEQFRRDFGGR
ncbi:MAG: hypothetical protein JNM89_12170 [Hyphomicrobiaceae bacterium]|nr:hypothetical protein [Hyphomicrobiaceae bacterium]